MRKQRFVLLGLLAGLFLVLAPACGDDDDDNGNGTPDAGTTDAGDDDAGNGEGFEQPEGTVPLYFSIDATQRSGEYTDEDLEWKGSFEYDAETRILTYSADWAGGVGPYPPLYDDGPWDEGGHEPAGATAGDDIFGIAAFLPVPEEELTIQYGAQTADGGWIWVGQDGTVTVPAGATDPITVQGMTLSPAGNVDVKVTLDTNNLDATATFDPSVHDVELKGTFTEWDPAEPAYDDGTHGDDTADDGIYTYVVSQADTAHVLVASGTIQEWVWVFDSGSEEGEYRDADSNAAMAGVAIYTMGPDDADWVDQTASMYHADNGNTAIEVP